MAILPRHLAGQPFRASGPILETLERPTYDTSAQQNALYEIAERLEIMGETAQMPVPPADIHADAGAGLSAVGSAISSLSGIFGNIGELSKQQNTARQVRDEEEAHTLFQQGMADYDARRAAEPDRPEKHPLFFSKAMEGVKKIVDRGDRFSKETQPAVRQVLQQQYVRTLPTVQADAIRAQRNQALTTLDTRLERAVEDQDRDGGLSLIRNFVDSGILSNQQAEQRQGGFETAFRAKGEQLAIDDAEIFVKAGDLDGAINILNDSPLSEEDRTKHTHRLTKRHRVNQFIGEVEELSLRDPVQAIGRVFEIGRGKSDDETILPSAQREGLLRSLFDRHHAEKQRKFTELNDLLDDGSIDTPEEIRETLAPLSLSEREIAPWIERLHSSGPPSRMRRWELEDDIALYDPDNDPYGAQADGLRGRMRLFGLRGDEEARLSQSLQERMEGKPLSGLDREVATGFRNLHRFVQSGLGRALRSEESENTLSSIRSRLSADIANGSIKTPDEFKQRLHTEAKPLRSLIARLLFRRSRDLPS